jgi:hypothetical protein
MLGSAVVEGDPLAARGRAVRDTATLRRIRAVARYVDPRAKRHA